MIPRSDVEAAQAAEREAVYVAAMARDALFAARAAHANAEANFLLMGERSTAATEERKRIEALFERERHAWVADGGEEF